MKAKPTIISLIFLDSLSSLQIYAHMKPSHDFKIQYPSMTLSERQAHIDEMIRQADFIRVEGLSQHFQVTTQTIHRDLNLDCERGFTRRV